MIKVHIPRVLVAVEPMIMVDSGTLLSTKCRRGDFCRGLES
ncbi:unnamed protein product [Acidithrix sp. C25]|nr:unnamed protein product [Acidithrix sp. C25]